MPDQARPVFPAVSQAGLHPGRVICCEGDKEEEVLASMEEGLSFRGFRAFVGELVRLPMTESRRLYLAAEKTGTMTLALRRWQLPIMASRRPRRRGGESACCRLSRCQWQAWAGRGGWPN